MKHIQTLLYFKKINVILQQNSFFLIHLKFKNTNNNFLSKKCIKKQILTLLKKEQKLLYPLYIKTFLNNKNFNEFLQTNTEHINILYAKYDFITINKNILVLFFLKKELIFSNLCFLLTLFPFLTFFNIKK